MQSIFEVQVSVPAGEQGLARIEKFKVSEEDSQFSRLRAMMHPDAYVRPGEYTRLYVGRTLMMSDTAMERRSNYDFVRNSHGHVLVAGLGIGLILEAILDKPEVESVTVIEKYQDVVDLVAPNLLAKYPGKLKVITADILDWRPPKGTLYNVIYFDIWPTICTDNLKDMEKLHRAFARKLDRKDPKAWMDSWQRDSLKRQKASMKRRNKYTY